MILLIRNINQKKKANKLLAEKNEIVLRQKTAITDSIEYASRIQSAVLTPKEIIEKLVPENFILFKPRDIVSGDFYWVSEKNGKVVVVAADCTGHGVPGAFMSMLGVALLNEIVNKYDIIHANEILQELRGKVITSLHQTGLRGSTQDGMDLALYILDLENRELEYAGANNSLLMFRNDELIEVKADKMPIGIHIRADREFTNHLIKLQKGDMLYTFSDGYPDQFGGPDGKKFMIKNFRTKLKEIKDKPLSEQKVILDVTIEKWMGDQSQIDDILVVGIRV
jgi:serine phosphatase RsbU (regulator of sigma subunit)